MRADIIGCREMRIQLCFFLQWQCFGAILNAGVPLIDRQRAVNECLAEEMPSIHALTMKTWTPTQFTKKRADGTLPPEVSSRLPLPSDAAASGAGRG